MDSQNLNAYQYRMTQLLEATIEMEAMKAENEMRKIRGESLAYGETDFMGLINKHGIHHNAACEAGFEITK